MVWIGCPAYVLAGFRAGREKFILRNSLRNLLFYDLIIDENTEHIITQLFSCIQPVLFVILNHQYPYPMQLMMYIGSNLIESVPLNEERISQPGYLGKFKRMLKDKYAELIREANTPPDFLIVDISPSSHSTSVQS